MTIRQRRLDPRLARGGEFGERIKNAPDDEGEHEATRAVARRADPRI